MGLFSIKPKRQPEPKEKESYYIEPTKEENPEEESHDIWQEQENQK